jgi:uncharacterized metal-binding protein
MSNEKKDLHEVSPKKIIGILPCSGACNVGMLTTKCVTQMAQKHENINFVCALGLPLGIQGIVNNAKKSEYYIALNGCDVGCASKALKSVQIEPDREIVVTKDLRIQKNKNYSDENGLDTLLSEVELLITDLQ